MDLSSEDILHHVMEKVTTEVPQSAVKRFHVSQTADQLPDLKVRNALYRSELEKQILEKREEDRRRRELEALEEDKLIRKIELDREKLRREYLEELERREKTQDEVRRKQQTIAKRLEELQIEEVRRKEEEAAKRKRLLLESLYQKDFSEPRSAYSSSYFRKPWNSSDYVYGSSHISTLKVKLEEIYATTPLHRLAEVYRNLESEKLKLRDIMRRRIARGEED